MSMSKPLVIAFLGRAGAGKSTASQWVIDNLGAERVSFAGPLKELAKVLMEFSDDQVYGSQEVKETVDSRYGITPRKFMQRLGQGAREIIGFNVWVDACFTTIKNKSENQGPAQSVFVIDDCRYVNEAAAIINNPNINGLVIKLVCPNARTNVDPTHPSEAQVDMVPPSLISKEIVSRIEDDGTSDLLDQVAAVMKELEVGVGDA